MALKGLVAALGGKAANGVHINAWPQWFWLGVLSGSIRVLAIRATGVICFGLRARGEAPEASRLTTEEAIADGVVSFLSR